jgi:iron complex outermembrane receptor protein
MNGTAWGSTLSIATAVSLLCAIPAIAAESPAATPIAGSVSDADSLTEIIVTARRVEERAQDVPISITVFTQQQLTDRNITNVGDLAAYTPSVSVDNQFGVETSAFSIRGFVQALNTTPSVAVYFADAVVPRGGNVAQPAGAGVAPGTFFDLQNLQVLKGPQGTLFGRNTDGGAVLLVPKKPTSQFEGYVEGSYGNYALNSVQAVLNVPLSDSVRVRLAVNHEQRNGYLDNVTGIGPSTFGSVGFTAARFSLVVDVTPAIENYLVASYNLSVNSGSMPQLFACNPLEPASNLFNCPTALSAVQKSGRAYAVENDLPAPESYLRQMTVVNTTTWHVSDSLTVKNIVNYGQLLTALDSSLFGTNLTFAGARVYATMVDPSNLGGLTTDQYTFSDELQIQGNALANKLTWQGGGYIERSGPLGRITGSRTANFLSCTNVATFQCSGFGLIDDDTATIHFTDLAIFGQATYAISNQLKLTAGARYTSDKTTSSFGIKDYTFAAPNTPTAFCPSLLQQQSVATGCVQSYRQDSSAPTYLIDLDYVPVDGTLLYAKYARGYRQGGVATFVADGYHLYRPEHVNAYEIGEKTTFHGPLPGIFNVSAFYNDFSNQQLLAGFLGGLGVTATSGIVNAGKSRIYGLEMETSIAPLKSLTLGASYTYLSTKLLSTTPVSLPPGGYTQIEFPSIVGGVLPFSPKNKLSTSITYHLSVPDPLGDVSLGAIFTYTSGALVTQASPLAKIPPYGLLNMNLTWNGIAGSSIDAELFASNITNRFYYNNVSEFFETAFGFESRYLGEARMYGARVRLRFGK